MYPARIDTVDQLDEALSTPTPALVDAVAKIDGELLILGVGGKMGPSLARLARRALDKAGKTSRVIGVARFTEPGLRQRLEEWGVESVKADLLDERAMTELPEASNVIYLAARKFGSAGNEPLTWAMNAYLPAAVAKRYRQSRIVALSTGNVYPFSSVIQGGPSEETPPEPIGEYAQSCLGRERMFQYFSRSYDTPVALIRLNYAIDLRYGVMLDVARKVHQREPIDLTMGHANMIWQGDANAAILRCLAHCAVPPFILNVTGREIVSIRQLAIEFANRLDRTPVFLGEEASTALLSNASRCIELMGPPTVSMDRMIDWIAHWVRIGAPTLDKPTHYDVRDGKF